MEVVGSVRRSFVWSLVTISCSSNHVLDELGNTTSEFMREWLTKSVQLERPLARFLKGIRKGAAAMSPQLASDRPGLSDCTFAVRPHRRSHGRTALVPQP